MAMATKEKLLKNLTYLTPLEMRTLNRYYLHPLKQRCCSKCFTIYDNYTENFHIKKYDKRGKVSYNVHCRKCCNATGAARVAEYRKDPEKYIKTKLTKYGNRARLQNVEFNLTAEYLHQLWNDQGGRCFYTDVCLSFEFTVPTKKYAHDLAPSLDRLYSEKGYTIGNVVWSSNYINTMKNKANYDEFMEYCRLILNVREKNDKLS